jgi:hypothetical protein
MNTPRHVQVGLYLPREEVEELDRAREQRHVKKRATMAREAFRIGLAALLGKPPPDPLPRCRR